MLKKTQIINFVLDQPNGQIRRKDLVHFICNLNGVLYDPVSCRGYYSVALQDTASWWRRGGFLMFSSKKEPRHLYRVRRGVYGVKDEHGHVLGLTYPPYDSAAAARAAAERAATAVGRALNRMKNEYEKPVKGTYDSATSADFRTPRMKNEQAVYDLNKSVKKLAEEEDNYLQERWDEEHEDFVHLRRNVAKKKPTAAESKVPRPIVTFGLLDDEIYIGLTDPKGDTMWTKLKSFHRELDTVLNFDYFNNNC